MTDLIRYEIIKGSLEEIKNQLNEILGLINIIEKSQITLGFGENGGTFAYLIEITSSSETDKSNKDK